MKRLEAEIGQLLIAGFSGHTLPQAVQNALENRRIGGVILFARNIANVKQVIKLTESILKAAPTAFISVDQEGGRVQRIRERKIPPMFSIGQQNDEILAEKVGFEIASELAKLGFNLNFAPCADVWTNPKNQVIGDRSFSSDPKVVARLSNALANGLKRGNVMPCAKHFPGHGDTLLDSHLALPTVMHDMSRLEKVELAPFRSLIRQKIPMIMTAHLLVPAIDPELPITLSKLGISRLLRQKMGYDGVVISDDLEMKAIADRFTLKQQITLGLHAEIDIFLICHTQQKWEEAFKILQELAENPEDRTLIEKAVKRVAKLKLSLRK